MSSLFVAAEMIDPKAKPSGTPLSNFPWPLREMRAQLSRGLATPSHPTPPRSPHGAPPTHEGGAMKALGSPGATLMDTMQMYAKAQQQINSTCISRNGHRYDI